MQNSHPVHIASGIAVFVVVGVTDGDLKPHPIREHLCAVKTSRAHSSPLGPHYVNRVNSQSKLTRYKQHIWRYANKITDRLWQQFVISKTVIKLNRHPKA